MGKLLFDSKGRTLIKSKKLGNGGEGIVYYLQNNDYYKDCCIKLYRDDKLNDERVKKLTYMVSNPIDLPPDNSNFRICWPIDLVFDEEKNVKGFIMRLAFNNSQELYKLKSNNSNSLAIKIASKYDRARSDGMKNRMKLMYNLSKAISIIHQRDDYVFVDLKPLNILFTTEGKITLIDLDSIQISNNEILKFKAPSSTPEYLYPPEADIWSNGSVVTKRWDSFSLSVIIYEILTGIHPFVGTTKDNTHELQELIKRNYFVWGNNNSQFVKIPQPHDYFHLLPTGLQTYFKLSLDINNSDPLNSWVDVLGDAIKYEEIKENIFIKGDSTPVICSFSSDKSSILAGQQVNFTWRVVSATNLYLDGHDVTSKSSYSLKINKSSKLEFKATNEFGTVRRVIDISVVDLPVISLFKPVNSKVKRGDSIRLEWKTANAENVFLNEGLTRIDVTGRNSYDVVSSAQISQYKLIAYSKYDLAEVCSTCSVEVYEPIKINYFASNRDFVIETLPIKLSWNVDHADKLILMPDNIDVTGKREIELYPKENIEYWLVASNLFFTKKSSILINVQKLPRFNMKVLPRIDIKIPDIASVQIGKMGLNYGIIDLEENVRRATSLNTEKDYKLDGLEYIREQIKGFDTRLLNLLGFNTQIMDVTGITKSLYVSFSWLQIVLILVSIISSCLSGHLVSVFLNFENLYVSSFIGICVVLFFLFVNVKVWSYTKSKIPSFNNLGSGFIAGSIIYMLLDVVPFFCWIYLAVNHQINVGIEISVLLLAVGAFFIIVHSISALMLKDSQYHRLIREIKKYK